MGKVATDGIIDGGLDKVATCTKMTVCAGQPVNFADIAARALAEVTMVGGDFTKANGDASGRKSTVASKSGINIDVSGTADHVVIDDGTSEYEVTTCTSQALTVSGSVTIPAWDIEIADPT